MTLNTQVHIVGTIGAEQAFDLALRAILTAADEMDRYEGAIIERTPAGVIPDWAAGDARWRRGWDRVGSKIGQGLPAITKAEAYPDGRLFELDASDDDEEPYGDLVRWNAEISWDTGYAFRNHVAPSASHLHAVALTHLHASLPEGASMRWCNEFTGEWHSALDGLEEFSETGFAAAAFAADVLRIAGA